MSRIEELERQEEIRTLWEEEAESLADCCYEIIEIYKRKEIMWKQRARYKWLKEEDANTAYFHRCANMRRRTNIIDCLSSEVV